MKILLFFSLMLSSITFSQVGIGTNTPAASAALDITATNSALLITRVANTAAITTPINGMMIYDVSGQCLRFYENDAWSSCIVSGRIATINCAGATNNGTLTGNVAASGVNSIIPYTGGNADRHNGQIVASTGVTGLTATLVAGTFAAGAGTLTYNITGTPAISGGTASFAINIGGQACTITRTVN